MFRRRLPIVRSPIASSNVASDPSHRAYTRRIKELTNDGKFGATLIVPRHLRARWPLRCGVSLSDAANQLLLSAWKAAPRPGCAARASCNHNWLVSRIAGTESRKIFAGFGDADLAPPLPPARPRIARPVRSAAAPKVHDESPIVKTAASDGRRLQLPVRAAVIRRQLLRVPFVPFTAGAILDPVGALVRESRVRLSLLFALADSVPPIWSYRPCGEPPSLPSSWAARPPLCASTAMSATQSPITC
jgi:hypothetical protein